MSLDEYLDSLNEDELNDVLDDLVHDLKSEEAAAINNGGRDEQIEYLRETFVKDDEVMQVIKDKFSFSPPEDEE